MVLGTLKSQRILRAFDAFVDVVSELPVADSVLVQSSLTLEAVKNVVLVSVVSHKRPSFLIGTTILNSLRLSTAAFLHRQLLPLLYLALGLVRAIESSLHREFLPLLYLALGIVRIEGGEGCRVVRGLRCWVLKPMMMVMRVEMEMEMVMVIVVAMLVILMRRQRLER